MVLILVRVLFGESSAPEVEVMRRAEIMAKRASGKNNFLWRVGIVMISSAYPESIGNLDNHLVRNKPSVLGGSNYCARANDATQSTQDPEKGVNFPELGQNLDNRMLGFWIYDFGLRI